MKNIVKLSSGIVPPPPPRSNSLIVSKLSGFILMCIFTINSCSEKENSEEEQEKNKDTTVVSKLVADTAIKSIRITSSGEITDSDDFEFLIVYSEMATLWSVMYNGNRWLAVGNDGTIESSTDGRTWTDDENEADESVVLRNVSSVRPVISVVNECYAVGDEGTIIQYFSVVSGVSWCLQSSTGIPASVVLYSIVCWGQFYEDNTVPKWVVVGSGGYIFTNNAGLTAWTHRPTGRTKALSGVTYNGSNLVVAVGYGGEIITSADCSTWTARTSGTTNSLYGVVYGNGIFIAVGVSGTILPSPDGITWTNRTPDGVSKVDLLTVGAK